MSKDYGEIFCEAVNTIVEERLQGLAFDQTVLCVIVDDSKRNEGIYTVSENGGITKFTAYSENTEYRNNDNVYIQIPKGDWDQQKIIISKKTDTTNEPYIYKSPFSSLVDITGNLINAEIETKETGLIANGETKTKVLWTYNWPEAEALKQETGLPFSAYTRFGLQAGFRSWLNPFYDENGNSCDVIKGEYGLKITFETILDTVGKENEKETSLYTLILNCDGMNGNPYDFASFFVQEKLFDISSLGQINKIKVEFYQEQGSFTDRKGNKIPAVDFLGNEVSANLFVNDIYLTFGYDVNEFSNEMVKVFTLDTTTYSRALGDNSKKLQLRWIHKQDDGSFKSITEQDELNYDVKWYRYELGHSSADEYSGVYWKYLSTQEKDENGDWEYLVRDEDWKKSDVLPQFFTSWSFPDTTLQTEKYKAIIFYNDEIIRSNILELTNVDEVVSKPTIEAVSALSVNCEDNTFGNYRIYNQGNSLLDYSQSAIVREWKPYFKGLKDDAPTVLQEAESIEWIIPWQKTMIVLNEEYYKDTDTEYWFEKIDGSIVEKDGYNKSVEKEISRIHIKRKSDNENISSINTQKYRIRSYYSQTYSDNTVQCKIVKEKSTYIASKEMTFGVAGTTGTDCTFILDFDNGITAVTNETNNAVTITARLYDYENNEVDISGKTIKWSWKVNQTLFKIVEADGLTNYQIEIQRNSSTVPTNKANYAILQAEMTDWGDFPLVAYLPIPLRSKASYDYISGTTQVIYNSNGELIDYFKNPYMLYDNAVAVDNVTWNVLNGVNGENAYTPKKTTNKFGEQYLMPLSFYVDNACQQVCVVGTTSDGGYWSQPILIMINRYPSAMVNQWDGKLKIDEKKGWILSPRLVAGKKESNNTFSGIMLGDFSDTDSDASLTSTDTGLYGYDKGEQSYAFKQDGSAFIGKSGAARINFKGNSGEIYSSGYNTGNGMLLNLSNNLIEAKKNNKTIFKLSQDDPYFLIQSPVIEKKDENGDAVLTESKKLMEVGEKSYYLQSANYVTTTSEQSGTHFDLATGELITNNGTFYGDVNIVYNGSTEIGSFWNSTDSTRTLNDILNELYNNTEGSQTLAWRAYNAATEASNAATKAQKAIDGLTTFLGVDYNKEWEKQVVKLKSGLDDQEASIQLGTSLTFYGVQADFTKIGEQGVALGEASKIKISLTSGSFLNLYDYIKSVSGTVTFG